MLVVAKEASLDANEGKEDNEEESLIPETDKDDRNFENPIANISN